MTTLIDAHIESVAHCSHVLLASLHTTCLPCSCEGLDDCFPSGTRVVHSFERDLDLLGTTDTYLKRWANQVTAGTTVADTVAWPNVGKTGYSLQFAALVKLIVVL